MLTDKFQALVTRLQEKQYTLSAMESCTGGGFMNALTNIEGASLVTKGGCVTYSNEDKIRCGIDAEIIEKYSVYSAECAESMAKTIKDRFGATIGVGITGNFNNIDPANPSASTPGQVFVCIYASPTHRANLALRIPIGGDNSRASQKEAILTSIIDVLLDHIN